MVPHLMISCSGSRGTVSCNSLSSVRMFRVTGGGKAVSAGDDTVSDLAEERSRRQGAGDVHI